MPHFRPQAVLTAGVLATFWLVLSLGLTGVEGKDVGAVNEFEEYSLETSRDRVSEQSFSRMRDGNLWGDEMPLNLRSSSSLRLLAVVQETDRTWASITTNNGEPVLVVAGDKINDMEVVAIEANKVLLSGRGETQTLVLYE